TLSRTDPREISIRFRNFKQTFATLIITISKDVCSTSMGALSYCVMWHELSEDTPTCPVRSANGNRTREVKNADLNAHC
ncbi:hypothetical protein L9F63_018586, partial [Diploptera punctata]